jgi:uncharacterized protein YbjT (DUF2867 family)
VDAAFLLWPSFSAEGAAPVVEALTEQVRRVVYLSALNVKDDQPAEFNGVWGEVEQLLAGSDWTFLRVGGFAANTLTWAPEIRAGSTVSMPSPKAGRSLIHERDIADIAVLALLDDAHIGRKYELTGPQVLTQEEQLALIGNAIGKDLRVVEQTPEEARQAMLAMGADKILAESSVHYWASLVDDPEPVTPDYKNLTGNPGRTFHQWAQDHADTFRLTPQPSAD